MNLPVRHPSPDVPSAESKALQLWRRLGLPERALDELLQLGALLRPGRPTGRPRGRADPREVLGAYSDTTLAALRAAPSIEAPDPDEPAGPADSTESIAGAVGRLRLLVGARDALLGLASHCDHAARLAAEALDRAADELVPQLRKQIALGWRDEAPVRALLLYHERHGERQQVRAAGATTIRREYGVLRLSTPPR